MSDIKKKLLEEIDQRIKKRREAKQRAAENKSAESFVLNFIKEIENVSLMVSNEVEWQVHAKNALNNLKMQLMTIDRGVKVDVLWHETESAAPQVHSVKIMWSKYHQEANNCDPEVYVDITSSLLK